MSKTLRIPITEWAPNVGGADHPGIYDIDKAYPAPKGYTPEIERNNAAVYGQLGMTTDVPLTGAAAYQSTGSKYLFWASQKNLFRDGTEVSKTSDVYTTGTSGAGGRWEFLQWGDDMLATNFVDPIQRINDMAATAFADLSAATVTPQAKTFAQSNNFVVAGYVWDATNGTSPQKVQWCALNDVTDWSPSSVTQAGSVDLLNDGGPIQRIFGGEYLIVMQERSVQRLSYVGPNTIWQRDEIVSDRGLLVPGAATQQENRVFYLAQDGFWMIVNGAEAIPIGKGRVNNWFFEKLAIPQKEQITCVADSGSTRVHWYYPQDTTGAKEALIYDYAFDKWSATSFSTDANARNIVTSFASNSSTEGDLIADIEHTPDGIVGVYKRNQVNATKVGMVETGWISLVPGRCAMVKSVKPGFDNPTVSGDNVASCKITVSRNLIGQSETADTTSDGQTTQTVLSNRFSVRANGVRHKFKTEWGVIDLTRHRRTELVYLEVEYVPTHSR